MKRTRIVLLLVFGMLAALLPLSAVPAAAQPDVTIMEIQGSGFDSPYVEQTVTTTGVVTLKTADDFSFWVQDPLGDGDPNTSDGMFVFGLGTDLNVGDLVELTDRVDERFGLTQMAFASITVLDSGVAIPAPVPITDLANFSMVEGQEFWEPLEGMLVSVGKGVVTSATSKFGEFGMLVNADAKPGSGFIPEAKQVFVTDLGGGVVDYNPERIMVDDSTVADPIAVSPGDKVKSLVGAVDFTFSMYKIQPASWDIQTDKLPKSPLSTRSGGKGDFVVTTFNVENLFDLELNLPTSVDVIGQVGFDPGSEWGSGLVSTKDNTLRRSGTVCLGDTDGSDAFDPLSQWGGYPQNTFDGLGSHSVTCGSTSDLIISEYVEGSSNNKAIEIYNGTAQPVDLAAEGYGVDFYFNGQTSAGSRIDLTGTVASGDVYVLADEDAVGAITDVADQESSFNFFNGNDAVVLRKGGKDDADSTPDPDELQLQLAKLVVAIEVELELPDILVVQEVENTAILEVLGDLVNAAAGTSYEAASFETSDARGIEVGFLWDADRVDVAPEGIFQLSGFGVEEAFGPGSASPGREPLVGFFEVQGETLVIVGNHFKSKGGDDPLYGPDQPPFRVTEIQRKAQAAAVRAYVDSIIGDYPLVMVTGDLNDFAFAEPGEGADHPVGILEGITGNVPFTNLVNLEKNEDQYSFIFDGNSQVLDHMLVSPALLEKLAGTDILHFNLNVPFSLVEADPNLSMGSSDHDPLEARFDMGAKGKKKK